MRSVLFGLILGAVLVLAGCALDVPSPTPAPPKPAATAAPAKPAASPAVSPAAKPAASPAAKPAEKPAGASPAVLRAGGRLLLSIALAVTGHYPCADVLESGDRWVHRRTVLALA